MSDGEITWGGLTLGGDSDYNVAKLEGWEDISGVVDMSTARSRGHGEHVGDQFSGARIVTVTGQILDSANRNSLAVALLNATPVTSDVSDLAVDLLGRRLTAGARIIRRSLDIQRTYSVGEIPFALQWKCPDPLRYGVAQAPVSTGLPTSGGGLAYPLAYPLAYGTAGTPGQVTLTNAGTAPAPFVFTVTGPLLSGFEVSAAGQRIRYETVVSSGETLTVDTGAGTVLAQGTADRRANLTVADWIQVPPLSSITLQFTSLGAYNPAATLTVPAFRSASW